MASKLGRGRLFALCALILIVSSPAALAFGNKSCASDPTQGYYCGTECDNLFSIYGSNWHDAGAINVGTISTSAVTGQALRLAQCPAGSVRVRQVDKNAGVVVSCVNLEGCGGGVGTVTRICQQVNTSNQTLEYHCATCAASQLAANGHCNGINNPFH